MFSHGFPDRQQHVSHHCQRQQRDHERDKNNQHRDPRSRCLGLCRRSRRNNAWPPTLSILLQESSSSRRSATKLLLGRTALGGSKRTTNSRSHTLNFAITNPSVIIEMLVRTHARNVRSFARIFGRPFIVADRCLAPRWERRQVMSALNCVCVHQTGLLPGNDVHQNQDDRNDQQHMNQAANGRRPVTRPRIHKTMSIRQIVRSMLLGLSGLCVDYAWR